MRIGRLVLLAGAGLAGYMTYKVVEVATRPIPPAPVQGINLRGHGLPVDLEGVRPEDEVAFAERFAAVVERRMADMRPRRQRRVIEHPSTLPEHP